MDLPKTKHQSADFLRLPLFKSRLGLLAVATETSLLDVDGLYDMLLDGAYSLQLIHYELYINLSHNLFLNLVDIRGDFLFWI